MDAIVAEDVSKGFHIGRPAGRGMLREAIVDLGRRHLTRSARSKDWLWVLRGLSLRIGAGEVVGIIGKNGAGKSTLLKVISRITPPTSGTIRMRGRVSSLLEVGTGFHDELTGRENVFLSGCILGMSRRQIASQFDSIVDFSGVEAFLDTPIKRYSSGMRLRLGFAVAAHLESDILLVDEVLAVGDGEFQRKCLQAMGSLQKQGRTVLLVSHNMAAIESLCSRVVWLDQGIVAQDSTPGVVLAQYIASFGAVPVGNDFAAGVARRGTGLVQFQRFEILRPGGYERLLSVRVGDSFILRLHFVANESMSGLIFGVQFHGAHGSLITQTHTYNQAQDVSVLAGAAHIDVEIRSLSLVPGQYPISIFAAYYGNIFHDFLEHCTTLEVQASSRFGLCRGMGASVFMLDSDWREPVATTTQEQNTPTAHNAEPDL